MRGFLFAQTAAESLSKRRKGHFWDTFAADFRGLSDCHAAPPPADGSLADDFRKDFFGLFKSDAYPTVYRGESGYIANGGWWSSTPGTYYWQVHAIYADSEPPYYHDLLSPVYAVTIAAPAPPPPPPPAPPPPTPPAPPIKTALALTLSEAYGAVKQIIRERSHHAAHHLRDKCRLASQTEARCTASWGTTARATSNTVIYAGRFRLWNEASGDYFTFRGLRARLTCLKHHRARHCSSTVHW
jgi:hypothetical protein